MDFIPKAKSSITPYFFKNIFTSQDFFKIDSILDQLPFDETTTYDKKTNKAIKTPQVRTSKVKWIRPNEQNLWLFDKIRDYISLANENQYQYDLYTMPVNIQYTEYYGSENGHYTWHMDYGEQFASFRKLSVSILYNDTSNFEGGNLDFWIGGNSPSTAPLEKGDMCVFSSFLLHRVSPVTKGVRKSLVIWVGGSTFK